jgi:hypothetical protein
LQGLKTVAKEEQPSLILPPCKLVCGVGASIILTVHVDSFVNFNPKEILSCYFQHNPVDGGCRKDNDEDLERLYRKI